MPTKTLLTKLAVLKKRKEELDAEIKRIESEKTKELRKEQQEKARIIGMAMLRLVEDGSWTEEKLLELVSPFIVSGKERRFLGLVSPSDKSATGGKKKSSRKPAAKSLAAEGSDKTIGKSSSKKKASPLPDPVSEDSLASEFNL